MKRAVPRSYRTVMDANEIKKLFAKLSSKL